jgi:uncharacterized tellurite resistance protein B-like protein
METLNYLDYSLKQQNIEYFIHLVRIAKADDIVSRPELELLHRIGKMLGFADAEIDQLIESTDKSDYLPPIELSKRFEQVYCIIKMALSDGIIDKNEMRLVTSFAIKSGFTENEIPKLLLLLIDGIKQGNDDDDLFELYKKDRKLLTETKRPN